MHRLLNRVLVCFFLLVPPLAEGQRNTWIATWGASPQAPDPDPDDPLLKIDGQTVRERVRVSVGGARICVRLSNEYGSTPLVIGSATVAVPSNAAGVKPGSIKSVTFEGRDSITIPAGAPALSDPIDFAVAAGSEISISRALSRTRGDAHATWVGDEDRGGITTRRPDARGDD